MNPDIDDLIRDTVRRQEQLAVDPERIRAALPARAARRRRTRTRVMLATVAAAVAVAVAVPVIVLRDNGNDPGPAASSTTGPAVPLYYRPTWLPAGMVERIRSVPFAAGGPIDTHRIWKSASADNGSSQQIVLMSYAKPPAGWNPPGGDAASNVDINGKPGYYDSRGDTVDWQVDENTKLRIAAQELGLSEEVLVRIARSVVPDSTRLRPQLSLDWLPDGLTSQRLEVKGDSPTRWDATITTLNERHSLSVSVGTTPSTANGETVTINGHTAHLARTDGGDHVLYGKLRWLLTMDLGNGRYLTVHSGSFGDTLLTRNDIIRIAEHVQVDPNPDIGWLGH